MYYSAEDFKRDIDFLANNIDTDYDVVIGLTRGGLVPAVALSHKLKIDRIIPVEWGRTYRQDLTSIKRSVINKKILIVDDILDDGTTLNDLIEDFKKDLSQYELKKLKIEVAVLIANCKSKYINLVDYVGVVIDRDKTPEWVDFFWEM